MIKTDKRRRRDKNANLVDRENMNEVKERKRKRKFDVDIAGKGPHRMEGRRTLLWGGGTVNRERKIV